MDIAKLQALISPFVTPLPPALVLGSQVYNGMIASDIPPVIALIGAIAGGAGMEMAGALSCSMAVKAFARRQWAVMSLAIGSAIAYAGFVVWGIATAANARAFIGLVMITLIAYLGSALWQWQQDYDRRLAQKQDTVIASTKAQAALLSAEARKIKAEKMSNPTTSMSIVPTEQSVRSVQRTSVQSGLDQRKLEITRQLLAKNPNATTREIAAEIGLSSPSSGKAYKDAALSKNMFLGKNVE